MLYVDVINMETICCGLFWWLLSHTAYVSEVTSQCDASLCLLWQVMLVVVHPPRLRTIFPSNTSVTITHLPTYSLFLLITRPYHFDLHSCTFLDKYPTLFSCAFFTTYLSVPYSINCWSFTTFLWFFGYTETLIHTSSFSILLVPNEMAEPPTKSLII